MTQEYILLLAQTLVGTCLTIPEAGEQLWGEDWAEEEMSTKDWNALNDLTLLCGSCGYWEFPCDMTEYEGEHYCNDCKPAD